MTTMSVAQDRSWDVDPGVVGDNDSRFLRVREVELNLAAHLVTVDRRQPVPLPPKEFGLLALLMSRAGRIVSQDELIAAVWGPDGAPAKSIPVYMRRLRRRLEVDPHHPRYIRSVWGCGYIIDI
jgi:two-component system response regulator VanR